MIKYIKGFWNYRFLLTELVKKGVRLKYRRSYLGIIWSLIEPVLTTIVLVIVFGTLFGNKKPNFPLYIITGRLIYSFFQAGTKAACTSIRKNASMIKKVYVPKYMYPLSDVLFNFIIFLISLIVLVFVDIYCKVVPTINVLWCIPAILILVILTVGVGLCLATLNVFFRDIEYLWNVTLMLIMYMSAIFYYPERIMNSGYSWLLKYNPLWQIIRLCRAAIMNDPDNISFMGITYALGFSVIALVTGIIVFKKNHDNFILHI